MLLFVFFKLISTHIITIYCLNPASDETLCPVSSTIHNNPENYVDLYFTYPIDIYSSAINHQISQQDFTKTYNCSNAEFDTIIGIHTCTTNAYCPLTPDNILSAKIIDDGKQCIHEENEIINIIIFGGSVTAATNAGGCCCSADIDETCTKQAYIKCKSQKDSREHSTYCGWPHYLSRYLSNLSIKYKVHNLGIGGHNSKLMSESAVHNMKRAGIQSLKSSDIVILDHSVNDAVENFHSKEDEDLFASGIEYLIRCILKYSFGYWPYIIIFEMFPFPHDKYIKPYDITTYTEFDYSHEYRRIGSYYNATIWSYKQLIWSDSVQHYNEDILNYLRFYNNYVDPHCHYHNHHPPWHVHLYIADLIANLFKDKFVTNCIITSTHISSNQKNLLPPSLSKIKQVICDNSNEKILNFDFTATYPIAANRYNFDPEKSWSHTEDRPNKYGLVSVFSDDEEDYHSLKAYINRSILNKYNENENIVLLFTFLRTYLNAGALEIDICNTFIIIVDALWKFYDSNFKSVPETFVRMFSIQNINRYCQDEPEPYINFYHYKHKSVSVEEDIARTPQQKFRIDKIALCIPEVEETELGD